MKLDTYLVQPDSESAASLARRLGVPAVLISQWRTSTRPVPVIHCVAIERATNGAVTRQDLRPDDWQDIWPELIAEPVATGGGEG
jgi:DNA-binding transcriptional regulator YdaS (Cro superfamily)